VRYQHQLSTLLLGCYSSEPPAALWLLHAITDISLRVFSVGRPLSHTNKSINPPVGVRSSGNTLQPIAKIHLTRNYGQLSILAPVFCCLRQGVISKNRKMKAPNDTSTRTAKSAAPSSLCFCCQFSRTLGPHSLRSL